MATTIVSSAFAAPAQSSGEVQDDPMEDNAGAAGASTAAGRGSAESVFRSLAIYAKIAWADCQKKDDDAKGSAEVRQEIYSTWALLLCLYYAEADAEKNRRTWRPQTWQSEAQALQHIFLENRSARVLSAVLVWLRWVHTLLHVDENEEAAAEGDASYDRTRLSLQSQPGMQSPLRYGLASWSATPLHPDGPLLQRDGFHDADLEEERRLLHQLWVHLRRGELRGALELCEKRGQAWRATMLQGMMPLAGAQDGPMSSDAMQVDANTEFPAKLKRHHTDWTEPGAFDSPSTSSSAGNPHRRIWKEQCWDTAQRHVQAGSSSMDQYELAIYGFCSGHPDALTRVCTSWADRCWGEMHCLKEWLVERLLDDGRAQWSSDIFLGEGDGGILDAGETSEGREVRASKLHGRLHRAEAGELDDVVAREACWTFRRVSSDVSVGGSASSSKAPRQFRSAASAPFARLQAALIEAAWMPERGQEALSVIQSWLSEGFDGGDCPYLVKQFASYFVFWQKETRKNGMRSLLLSSHEQSEDDIVWALLKDHIKHATDAWAEQCLQGRALYIISDHLEWVPRDSRMETYARLVLQLGLAGLRDSGIASDAARRAVLRRSLLIYGEYYPEEVIPVLALLVWSTLRMPAPTEAVSFSARPPELFIAVECVLEFWIVVRHVAADADAIGPVARGLVSLFTDGRRFEFKSSDDFLRAALDQVMLPFLNDALMGLIAASDAKDLCERVGELLNTLRHSHLRDDAFRIGAATTETLKDLEWYLDLCCLWSNWDAALRAQQSAATTQVPPRSSSAAAAESHVDVTRKRFEMAHEELVKHASLRLAQDREFLEPAKDVHSVLSARWRDLQQLVASKVLFLLLHVFEETRDFEGAIYDLSVAVAQSPWMLKLSRASDVRQFLLRLSYIPTFMPSMPWIGCEPTVGTMLTVTG